MIQMAQNVTSQTRKCIEKINLKLKFCDICSIIYKDQHPGFTVKALNVGVAFLIILSVCQFIQDNILDFGSHNLMLQKSRQLLFITPHFGNDNWVLRQCSSWDASYLVVFVFQLS